MRLLLRARLAFIALSWIAACHPWEYEPGPHRDSGLSADAASPPWELDGATQPPMPSDEDAGANEDASAPRGDTCLRGTGDFSSPGPYAVERSVITIGSLGEYTIFAPTPLDPACPHPLIAWGNGTGQLGPELYSFLHERAASWGMVVIASHATLSAMRPYLATALDYMLAQNEDASSPFFHKLSGRAGASGHSQGGAAAEATASHPNVEALVNVQGSFGPPPTGVAFLCLTGSEDIVALASCESAVNSLDTPAFYASWQGADHWETPTLASYLAGDPGTLQYTRLYAAWFRCFLADDAQACALFRGGSECPLCSEPGWSEIFGRNF